MPVPIVDFDNDFVPNNTPSAEQLPKWLLWLRGMAYPVKWLYGVFMGFMYGESFSPWGGAVAYRRTDAVQYNYKTYESMQDGNLGNQPDTSPDWWVLRNDNFIGVKDRARYTGRYLSLTHYLNKQFGTTFRQPPYPAPYDYGLGGGVWSDIYITNDTPVYPTFLVGATEAGSDSVSTLSSTGFVTTTEVYVAASTYKYVINIPVAVYAGINIDPAVAESIVRRFVDVYNPAGIFYRIATY